MTIPLNWYDENDDLVADGAILSGTPGAAGGTVVRKLILNKDSVGPVQPTLQNLKLWAGFRDAGSNGPFKAAGHSWAEGFVFEVQVTGGWKLTPDESGWVKLGSGTSLPLPNIGNDEGVVFDVRLNPNLSEQGDDVEIAMLVDYTFVQAIVPGGGVPIEDFVWLGLRDASFTALTDWGGNVVENPGGADNQVQVPTMQWVTKGEPYAKHVHLKTLAASAGGNERYDLIHLDENGVSVVTGTEVTAPAADGDKPPIPAGAIGLAYVLVNSSGTITNNNISQLRTVGDLFDLAHSPTDFNVTIGAGPRATVDGVIVNLDGLSVVPLGANQTNYIFLLRDGSWAVTTTGVPPNARAQLMWEAVTDGSGVTSVRDHRAWGGPRIRPIEFPFHGTLTASDAVVRLSGTRRNAKILPVRGAIRLALGAQQTGASAGATTFELEKDDGDGDLASPVSLLDSTDRPSVAYDATDLRDLDIVPAVHTIEPDVQLRASVFGSLPTGASTQAQNAVLQVQVAE